MAAITADKTPATRSRTEVLETLAVVNLTPSTTRFHSVSVPEWAVAVTFLLDLTITGTTPLFDFTVYGGQTAGGRAGATFDSTTDIYQFISAGDVTITQLTTDASTPITAITIGPSAVADTTGSATANSAYAFNGYLPPWLIYKYVMDGTTGDEDYAGTISVVWHKRR